MKAVMFPQANVKLAENQEEYETLPVYVDVDNNGNPVLLEDGTPRDPCGEMTCCFELTDDEIAEIISTRQLWYTGLTFWNPFQPIRMTTTNPFK